MSDLRQDHEEVTELTVGESQRWDSYGVGILEQDDKEAVMSLVGVPMDVLRLSHHAFLLAMHTNCFFFFSFFESLIGWSFFICLRLIDNSGLSVMTKTAVLLFQNNSGEET